MLCLIYPQNSWRTQRVQSEQKYWVVRGTWWRPGHRFVGFGECCGWAWHEGILRNPPQTESQSSLQATKEKTKTCLNKIIHSQTRKGLWTAIFLGQKALPQGWGGEYGQWLFWCQRCLCSARGPAKEITNFKATLIKDPSFVYYCTAFSAVSQ